MIASKPINILNQSHVVKLSCMKNIKQEIISERYNCIYSWVKKVNNFLKISDNLTFL